MDDPRKGFETPPEVTAYFAQKNLRPAFSWADVWREEHAYAFTVAKAVDAELLGAFRKSILSAIERGEGFETWRAGLLPELEKLGWARPRLVADPTGRAPDRMVNFAAPRRLQTIFWGNVRTAQAAGQWERIQRTKAGLPYLLYVRTVSAEPRKDHLAFVGVVLPVDDPWWATHFPPNGWHCKCSIWQITRREADKYDGVEGYTREPPRLGDRTYVNSRTGEVSRVPAGIDPGWDVNPGLARARTLLEGLQARLDAAGPQAARKAVAELMASPTPQILAGLNERLRMPVAVSPELQRALAARSPVIMASNDMIAIKLGKHGLMKLDDFRAAQAHIDGGEMIDDGQPGKKLIFLEAGGRLMRMVVQASKAGYLRIATFHVTDRRRLEAARWRAAELDEAARRGLDEPESREEE